MSEESSWFIVWNAVSSPPIVVPLLVTFASYLLTIVLTAREILISSSPRYSSAKQTPSPNTHPPGQQSGRNRGSGSGLLGNPSPENIEAGIMPNMPGTNSGKAHRVQLSRTKTGYGSMSSSRNTNTSGTGPSVPSNDDNAGGGSSGNNTRQYFYKLLFIALLSRIILLPLEASFLGLSLDPDLPGCMFARTLPDLVFASAFSLLVLFYAQLAGTASGGPKGLSIILLHPGYFRNVNIIVYVGYFVLLLLTIFYPGDFSQKIFQSAVWLFLSILYLILLVILAYFGPVLVNLLGPSLAKRSDLSIRLVAMCILCSLIFLSRCISFALGVFRDDVKFRHGFMPIDLIKVESEDDPNVFLRDCIGYGLLELIPSLAILYMMHQRRPAFHPGDDTVQNGGRYAQLS